MTEIRKKIGLYMALNYKYTGMITSMITPCDWRARKPTFKRTLDSLQGARK